MGFLANGLDFILLVVRPAVLGLAVLTGAAAVASWASRTRRIQPFSALARLTRKHVDPLLVPVEQRVVKVGGQPSNAPWWALAGVVVGGLLLISGLEFLRTQLLIAEAASRAGVRGLLQLSVIWTVAVLRLAIIARVISTWVGGSRYTTWWKWAYIITDPFMIPLQRVLPTLGPIDVSPLVAYFGLGLLRGLLLGAL